MRVVVDYSLHLTGNSAEPRFLAKSASSPARATPASSLHDVRGAARRRRRDPRHPGNGTAAAAARRPRREPRRDRAPEAAAAGRRPDRAGSSTTSARPALAEAEAAGRVLALARRRGAPVYFVHVSAAETLDVIPRARAAGQTVYAEVTPQHLLLDDWRPRGRFERGTPSAARRRCGRRPTRRRCGRRWPPAPSRPSPPIIARGISPPTGTRGRADFTKIPNGLARIENAHPVLYTEGVEHGPAGHQPLRGRLRHDAGRGCSGCIRRRGASWSAATPIWWSTT